MTLSSILAGIGLLAIIAGAFALAGMLSIPAVPFIALGIILIVIAVVISKGFTLR